MDSVVALFSSLTTALEWQGDAFHCPSTITNRIFTEISGLEKYNVSSWRSPGSQCAPMEVSGISVCPQEVPRVSVYPHGGPQGLCVPPGGSQGLCVPPGGPQGLCVSPWRFQGSLCVAVGNARAPGAPASLSVFLSFHLFDGTWDMGSSEPQNGALALSGLGFAHSVPGRL